MEAVWVVLGVTAAGLLLLMVAAAFVFWKIQSSDEKKLGQRIARLAFVDKLALAWSLFRDPRISIGLRLIAVGLVLYVAMPLDLIPDFIPVIGYLDDLLIVLIGAGLLLRSIPRYIIEEHVGRYEKARAKVGGRK